VTEPNPNITSIDGVSISRGDAVSDLHTCSETIIARGFAVLTAFTSPRVSDPYRTADELTAFILCGDSPTHASFTPPPGRQGELNRRARDVLTFLNAQPEVQAALDREPAARASLERWLWDIDQP